MTKQERFLLHFRRLDAKCAKSQNLTVSKICWCMSPTKVLVEICKSIFKITPSLLTYYCATQQMECQRPLALSGFALVCIYTQSSTINDLYNSENHQNLVEIVKTKKKLTWLFYLQMTFANPLEYTYALNAYLWDACVYFSRQTL